MIIIFYKTVHDIFDNYVPKHKTNKKFINYIKHIVKVKH